MRGNRVVMLFTQLALVISLASYSATSASAPYPFPAPGVQCRSDLAWLRLAMPEVLISLHPGPGARDGEVFTPSMPETLPPVLQDWQQLQQARYCEPARALRHRVA